MNTRRSMTKSNDQIGRLFHENELKFKNEYYHIDFRYKGDFYHYNIKKSIMPKKLPHIRKVNIVKAMKLNRRSDYFVFTEK